MMALPVSKNRQFVPMKPNAAFLSLLTGALPLTVLRTDLTNEAERTFVERANACQNMEELVLLIKSLSDLRTGGSSVQKLKPSELFLQGNSVTINLAFSSNECEVRIRIQPTGETKGGIPDCTLVFDAAAKPRPYSNGKDTPTALGSFIRKAEGCDAALTAEVIAVWLRGFGLHPKHTEPKTKKAPPEPVLAAANA